jgi:hypothetical protein
MVKRSHRTISQRLKGGLILAVLLCAAGLAGEGVSQAQVGNRAALLIQYGEGEVWTACVPFEEPEITGLELLLRAGLEVVSSGSSGMGSMVCKIGQRGCDDPTRCLCECKGAACVYWSYWHQVDGAWRYSNVGASSYRVRPGAVEAWVWGPGSIAEAPQPPPIAFDQICLPPTATPTATPPPTSTAIPAATVTPTAAPSATPPATAAPTPTASPTSMPTPTASPTSMPTASATPAGGAEPAPPVSTGGDYLFYAALVAVLGVLGYVVLRRRPRAG